MDKLMRFGLVFIIIIGILFIINQFFLQDYSSQIKSYLLNSGYHEDSSDKSLLEKKISGTTTNYFSLADYTLSQRMADNSSGVSSTLNETYDFKNHHLDYNYRVEYSNNINVIFRGSYYNDSFTCDKEFSTAKLENNEVDNTCNLIKIKVERFYREASVLFNNYRLIEYMENKGQK